MPTELRPYQTDLIHQVLQANKQGNRRICLVSPTGSGKTVVAAALIQHFTDRGLRVMFQVDRDCLIGQTRSKLWDVGYRDQRQLGFIKAGMPENYTAKLQIASQQTLIRRNWWRKRHFDVIFFDECHTTAFGKAAQQTREHFPKALYIGLTATPMRMKKDEGLSDHFNLCIAAPVPHKLTAMGYLAPMDYYSLPPTFIDLSRVRITGGDFDSGDLGIACSHPQSIERCFEEYQKHGQGQSALIFAATVAHAEALADRFNQGGVTTEVVTSKTSAEIRRKLYTAFKKGEIQALSSVNCISTGFDVPNAVVGIVARPTKSEGLWYQMVGRLMRPAPGKEKGIILDIAGNTWRFGIPDQIEAYELDFSQVTGTGAVPFKTCESCGLLNFISAKVCKGCGSSFPIAPKKPVTTDLVLFQKGEAAESPEPEGQTQEKTKEEALRLAHQALASAEKRFGVNHTVTTTRLDELAQLYKSMGRYEGAVPLYKRLLAIHEQKLGINHPDTVNSLETLVGLYKSTGRYKAALSLYKRSLAICEQELGTNHPDTATSLNNLAGLYNSMGHYEAALPLYERSLAIREQESGANHPDTATSLNNLAALHYSMGRYEAALPSYERSLVIREQELGATHPDTAASLNNLAGLYESLGRYEAALPLYKRSLVILEQELGTTHPHTATSLNNLAGLYKLLGRYDAALPLYERSVAIFNQILGPDHPNTQAVQKNLQIFRDTLDKPT